MPVEWAATTNNLALAYAKRIQEDRADNLEQAIALYQDALTVRTKQAMPVEWAETLNNLALAYARRIRGDQAENLERAIILYQDALTEMTQLSMPIRWAQILNSLANAYYSRIQGDRTENLEQAIAFYQDALTVRTKQSMPVEWAETLNNLANAYSNRIRGDRAENLEQAIALYQHALTVFTQQSAPINWADSINNLASAYYSRIQGDRAENLEQAIVLYQDALTVRTKQAMPIDWAATTNNLAVAFRNRIQGDRADNLEQAIALYQDALTVRTKQAMPVDWAQTMMNLATTYSDRIRDDRTENLKQAISAYQSCLEVFKPDLFPNDCRRSARSLGNLYSEQQRWEEAALTYQKGLQAAEILYQSAILLDSKTAELTETADLPRRAAYAFARSGNLQTAVLILEQGRARGLSEALNRDRADLRQLQKTHIQLYNQYQDITIQLRNLETQDRLRMTSEDRNGLTPGAYRNLAGNLRQQLDALLQKIRRIPGYEALLTPTTFTEISEAVRDYRPLVYLVSNPLGSLALVVTGSTLECLWLDDFPEKRLREILDGPAEDPEVSRLFGAYQNFRNDPKTNYDIWCEEIEHSAYQLWEPLMLPVIEYLKEQHFQQAILIPTELLNFLPLHVAWIEDSAQPTGKRYALDEILLTYAPNARSLNAAETIARRTKAESILAIDNPLKDLPNSSYEVTAAVRGFTQSKILKHEEATIEAVLKALPHHDVLHLSCHGTANLGEPLNNGLIMCDGLLTLRDILSLKLAEQEQGGIRLATLSACETGLAGIEAADEVISLSTGLLQAGVAGVVTSLWPVSDLSTMLLEVRFYDYWRNDGLEPAIALHQSQQWVRDTTNGEKLAYFRNCTAENSANRLPASTADYLYKSLVLSRLSDRDFAHPFHWAAFSYVGV
jgi:CHAT domain-containing protein